MKNYKKIRDLIIDSESLAIYDHRLNYSHTGNQDIIWDMLTKIDGWGGISSLNKFLLKNNKKKIIIFGAGYNGVFLRECLRSFDIVAYFDNKVSTVINESLIDMKSSALSSIAQTSIPIYNPSYYAQNEDINNTIVIISVPGFKPQLSITQQLIGLGFNQENIFAFQPSNSLIPQYFQVFQSEKTRKETFVDCGVLDGDTCFDFARWCLGNYRKIFAFEADKTNYIHCKENLSKLKDVELFNLGVWDEVTKLRFNNTASGFSNIIENGAEKAQDSVVEIDTCRLDDVLDGEEITFIKMDIEGAELNALKGASKIISTQKPKLAICVYHKPEDIWEIPELLLDLNPDYKFRLRHYGPSAYETVLYAQ